MLGVIAFAAGEAERALEYLAQAITAKPDYDEAHNNLGNLLRDLGRLTSLRASLRGRLAASPLCNAAAYAREVEAACRDMWRTWCR